MQISTSPNNPGLTSFQMEMLSRTLKAIAHPVRLSIIDMLQSRKRLTVTEIYTRLNADQSAISHHLSIMKDRGILGAERRGKNIYYYLKETGYLSLIGCIQDIHMKAGL